MKKAVVKIIDKGMLDDISNFISPIMEPRDLINILGTTKITMIMETNRLQSLILCELQQSYSIQSQRYCKYDNLEESVIFENMGLFTEDEQEIIRDLLKRSMTLYSQMTVLKDSDSKRTKFKKDDFLYGIPVDDARYCLPTSFTCNCEMTIDGDKIIDFINDIKNSGYFSEEFIDSFISQIPTNIMGLLGALIYESDVTSATLPNMNYNAIGMPSYIPVQYKDFLLNEKDRIILSSKNKVSEMQKTGAGALMCTTNNKTLEDIFNNLDQVKAKGITERVAYGSKHTSIAEHSFMTFVAKMSIACYNQYIRHRHHKVKRQKFDANTFSHLYLDGKIANNIYIIPDCIKQSVFHNSFVDLMNDIESFISRVSLTIGVTEQKVNALMQLLPMGTEITVIINTNLINELKNVAPKRTCMNAQWEIRKITHQKLNIIKNLIGDDNKLLEWAKPNCLQGNGCTEGLFTCGNNSEVRNLFLSEV